MATLMCYFLFCSLCKKFLHRTDEEVQEIVSQLQFLEGKPKDVVEDLIEQMDLYCNPRKNVMYERFLF